MICLRGNNDAALQGEGFTPEEESLPFYLAKATTAVPEDCPPDTRIDIVYWRQMDGDPNKTFIEGQFNDALAAAAGGIQARRWRGIVERESVLYIDPGFKAKHGGRSKQLDSTTLQELAALHHPELRGWVYEAVAGLVYREPITNIAVGDFFLVSLQGTLSFFMKTQGWCVIANLPVDEAAAGLEIQTVGDATWYYFEADDLNGKFKAFKPVKGGGECTSEVRVSHLLLKLTPGDVKSKKLSWATKQKLIKSKFQSTRNLWVLDEEDKVLIPKKSK